jgi:predicted type IV restriction endonuclease
MNGIIITINLPGRIGGSVSHTSTQAMTIEVFKSGNSKPVRITREILHTDRSYQVCYKKTQISEEVVNSWISNTIPEWSNKKDWSKMSSKQRLVSYVSRFDEGYGVNFEEL